MVRYLGVRDRLLARELEPRAGDLQEFIGERALVKEKISPKAAGKVEFHGTNWAAEADEEIAEGATVEITGKENITLKVKVL